MVLSRNVSEIVEIAKFSHPLYFTSPLKGFALELGTVAWGQKTRMIGLSGRQISLTVSSAVCIQSINVTDRQTDRQTDTGWQQRPYLHSVAW